MDFYNLIHLLALAILFRLAPAYVIDTFLPSRTDAAQAFITLAPDLKRAALFRREGTNTCGYVTGNPNLPDTCSSPFICQWYTSAAGYPGQKFCTTNAAIVTANYGDYCIDYGNNNTNTEPGQTCGNSKVPYCVTVEYASGPGDIVEYTSYYCSTNTVSRTKVIYFEATTPVSPTTVTVPSISTPAPGTTIAVTPVQTPVPGTTAVVSSTPTVTPSPSSTSHGLDTGSIIGIIAAAISFVGIFTAAFTPRFQFWVLFALPNALCFQTRIPDEDSPLFKYFHPKKSTQESAAH